MCVCCVVHCDACECVVDYDVCVCVCVCCVVHCDACVCVCVLLFIVMRVSVLLIMMYVCVCECVVHCDACVCVLCCSL